MVTLNGLAMKIAGSLPAIGSKAPDFTVTKNDLSEVRLSNYLGHKVVLNIFPSLDTNTCAMAMKRFNDIASKNKKVLVLCISADLPFAQKRFCGIEHLENIQPASIFRHPEFGSLYGVGITEGMLKGLLARSVVVIDETGKVTYTELVPELSKEPDYEKVLREIQ